jgi:plastocyanin
MNYRYMRGLGLLALLLLSFVLAACGDSNAARGAPSGQAGEAPAGGAADMADVQVVAKEFEFAVSPAQAKAGSVTFAVKNDGHAPHDFRIRGEGLEQQTAMLQSGDTTQFTVELAPGTYDYQCTVGGHEQLGMKGTLTIVP